MKKRPRLLPLTPQEYKKTGKYSGYLRKKYAFQDTPLTEIEVFQKWVFQKGNSESGPSRQHRKGWKREASSDWVASTGLTTQSEGLEMGTEKKPISPIRSRLKEYHPQLVRGGNRKRSRTRDLVERTQRLRDQVQVKETSRLQGKGNKGLVEVQSQLEGEVEKVQDPHAQEHLILSMKRKDAGRTEREEAWDQLQLQKERSWWRAGWNEKGTQAGYPQKTSYPQTPGRETEEGLEGRTLVKSAWKAGWTSTQRNKLRKTRGSRPLQAKSRGKLNRLWSLRGKKGRSILSSSGTSVPSLSRRSKRRRLRA